MIKKSKKILIVDDEESLSEMLKEYFLRQGYVVETAFDGEEGLVKIKKFKPDLVLLDILMPVMDGIEMLKHLKADTSISATPVVMLTNLDTKDRLEEAMRLGINDYLIKLNYSPEDLDRKTREILNIL